MGKKWRQWIRDKGLEKWFRRDNLVVLVLVGILLFIIAIPVKKDSGESGENAGKNVLTLGDLSNAGDDETAVSAVFSQEQKGVEEEYAADLERRLTDTLSKMAGVGKVKVMITLKTSRELVVEKDHTVNRSATNENDSQGGNRTISETDSSEETVYSTGNGVSEPYVTKTYTPQVEGVLVVAQGAGSGTVNRTIVEIVEALFGVEAHKVMVVKME